jgi:hypothetical protein
MIRVAVLVALMLIQPALGAEVTKVCLDNNTLQINTTETRCLGSECKDFSKVNLVRCSWGCMNNECVSPPYVNYLIIIGVLLLLGWASSWLIFK